MIDRIGRTICTIDTLSVDVLETLDDLRAIKQERERVYDADPDAQHFLAWTWMYNWLAGTKQRWLILAVRAQNGQYAAFFPLRSSTELGIDSGFRYSLRMAGSYFASYTGFICDPTADAYAIPALGRAVQKLNWAELHFDDVFPSERRLQFLFDTFSKSNFAIVQKPRAPHLTERQVIDHDLYVTVPLEKDWETFLKNRLGSHTRYNARTALKRVETDGDFRISIADSETIGEDLEALLRLWGARWAAKNPAYAKYVVQNVRNMIPRCFADGSIFVPVLWKGDDRIALTLNFADRRKRRLIQFLAGRDQSVKRPPPGFALNLFAMRWAIANGFDVYDFGTGNFSYKYDFGGQDTLVRRYRIDVRSGANLYGQIDSSTLDSALEEVARAYKARELLVAERGCREVLRFDPGRARFKELLETIDKEKNQTATLLAEAINMHNSNRPDKAAELYQNVLEIDSANLEALYRLGAILFQSRSYDEAEKLLRKAVQLNRKSARAFNNLGSILTALGRLPEALDCFARAASLSPNYAVALKNHADVKAIIERGKNHFTLASTLASG